MFKNQDPDDLGDVADERVDWEQGTTDDHTDETGHDDHEVAALHMLAGQEEADEPEDNGGPHASRGHVGHGGHPLVEKKLGDGNAESEDDVRSENGGMCADGLVLIHDLLYRKLTAKIVNLLHTAK